MTIHEFLGNDFTSCYIRYGEGHKWEGVESQADSLEIERYMAGELPDVAIYYVSPYLSFGDYDNSCQVERSNVRVFLEKFKDVEGVRHYSGSYGHESIRLDLKLDNEEIIECLTALANYPAIDDQDVSLMNIEMEKDDWENWIKRDFKKAVAKKWGVDEDDDIPELEDDPLWELYCDAKDEANVEYIVEMGGNGWVEIEKIVDAVDIPDRYQVGEFELLLDENRGIYIPRDFANIYGDDLEPYDGIEEDLAILKEGPDNEMYWEAMDNVCAESWLKLNGKEWDIEQDGDLWIYERGKPRANQED